MKKTILIVSSLICVFSIHAQEEEIKKRNLLFGGNISGSYSRNTNTFNLSTVTPIDDATGLRKDTDLSFEPYILYKLKDKHLIGTRIRSAISNYKYESSFQDNESWNKNSRFTIGMDLIYRLYFISNQKFNIFFQPSLGYSKRFFKSTRFPAIDPYYDRTNDYYEIRSNIDLGVSYQILEGWNIFANIIRVSYSHTSDRANGVGQNNEISNSVREENSIRFNSFISRLNIGLEKSF